MDVADAILSAMLYEEELVISDFCKIIRQACGSEESCNIKAIWRVPVRALPVACILYNDVFMQNTAVVFFRRFYLYNSLRAHDPIKIM
jgi:hypothetical protein